MDQEVISNDKLTTEEEINVQMEIISWSCEVRHLLSRLICLGPVCTPQITNLNEISKSCDKLVPETSESPTTTDSAMYTLIRNNKCPLLWTLKGANDVILQLKDQHDVILFPQSLAKYNENVIYVDSIDTLTFVRLEAQLPKLQSQPETTLRELEIIHTQATDLRIKRDEILQRLQACSSQAYSKYRSDLSSKYHKHAISYINEYMKTIAPARSRCKERLSTRQTQFKVWFDHMVGNTLHSISIHDSNDTPEIPLNPPRIKQSPPGRKQSPPPVKIVKDQPETIIELPPSPPFIHRNPAKPRIIHWHVQKLSEACRKMNPNMVDAIDIAEIIKETIDYLMPLDCFSPNQMNQTMLAIEKNLSSKNASEIRHVMKQFSIGSYITSFFPIPYRKSKKLPSLNRRGCHVHFADMIHHVKYFYMDDIPISISKTKTYKNNENIREGVSIGKRPSLSSQCFDMRSNKYIRRN